MKKLFTYLLISSMVVLSSCTNYDDQFDDLNSQLTTLKSQIEGFSSLSSGLTALQGTVASLRTAIDALPKTTTPATDISGLQTALTALAATVAELKTSLATAATTADVAALTASLAQVQTDLAELLASNNVYTGPLTINSASTLTAAEALGGKLAIINGTVTIVQSSSNGVDSAKLQAVVDKMITITDKLTYTHSGTDVVAVNFSKLSGTKDLEVNQEAPISFPELSSAAVVTLTANSKVTSFSAPKLASVTSFSTMAFSSATDINLSSLKYYDAALSITTKSNGSVHLDAFENVSSAGTATAHDLTIVNAITLSAPKLSAGKIVADKLSSVSLPMWVYASSSSFADAKTVSLPKITAGKAANVAITQTLFPKAETIDITAASNGTYKVSLTLTQDNVKSLTVKGVLSAVTINSATDLTSLDITATVGSMQVSSTDIVDLVIGSTLAEGNLTVTNNADLESITGATLNLLENLNISMNTRLATISMPALKAVGADKGAIVIEKNALKIDKIIQKSATNATVTVARSVASADFFPLVTFLGAAKTKGSSVVAKATDTSSAAIITSVVTALGADTTAEAGDEIVMNWVPASQVSNENGGLAHVEQLFVTANTADATVLMDGFATEIVNSGGSVFNDVQTWADLASNQTKFSNGGYAVTYGRSVFDGNINITASAAATATFKLTANSQVHTVTIANNSDIPTILNALYAKIGSATGNSGVYTSALFTVTTSTGKLNFQTLKQGEGGSAFTYSLKAYEDAATTTETTNAVFSATTNAMVADNNKVWIKLAALTKGAAGVKATSISGQGSTFSAVSLTASGTNVGNFATGDDNSVNAATEGTAQTSGNATTVAAAKVDNTATVTAG